MMRERAQQSWPALANTDATASLATCSISTSAKMTLGDLPPSSRPIRLMVAAAALMIARPVAVSPVKPIFATSACAASRTDGRARPRHDVEDAGHARVERQLT